MESEGRGNRGEKPVDDTENSEFARNFSVSYSAVTFDIGSNGAPIPQNTGEPSVHEQNRVVSEDPISRNEGDIAVLSEANSTSCVERDEFISKTSSKLKNDYNILSAQGEDSAGNKELSQGIVKTIRPLCADYRSDSGSESVDSESDSSAPTSSSTDTSSSESEEEDENSSHESHSSANKGRKQKERKAGRDLPLSELPPIEDLKISVPENACVEVGQISSIVDTLVVVESYKGTAALDVDTVLFLDCGKRTLGKVFDILGPITEPVYTVRFNSQDQIKSLAIEKGQKVYYAPKTQHTLFVFLSEVLKNKGSDASWKDNIEAPSEFQDFSDDEEERLHKNKQIRESDGENGCAKESKESRKRSFNRTKQSPRVLQPSRFRHAGHAGIAGQRPNSPNYFIPPPAISRPHFPCPVQPPPFPYAVPPYPPTILTPPPMYHTPRLFGPPFPAFGGIPFPNQSQPYHRPLFQQRTHAFPQSQGPWGRPILRPPPPPPPPDAQSLESHSNGKI